MNKMTEEELLKILTRYNQDHLVAHYKRLSVNDRDSFRSHMEGLDVDLVFHLHQIFSQRQNARLQQKIKPASVIPLPSTPEEIEERNKVSALGKSAIQNNKIAVLIAAGGQASRLGFDGPKGVFPITPVKNKSLFQLFSETIRALSQRYRAHIPLLIMTSEENHDDTITFFKRHEYFGLDKQTVYFFKQGMLPSITPDGKLILKDTTHLFTNPDGHGGALKALRKSGLLSALQDHGITDIFYCQVDNPLVKIADPLFIGYHRIYAADISTKVVRRRNIQEKVGVYLSLDGRDAIVEYSDAGDDIMSALDKEGNLLYWAGNIAIHIFNIPFLERLYKEGFDLPYHCATKHIKTIDEGGTPVTREGWKFETFIFDAIPLANKTCCMEVIREEEFAPVKNKDGDSSPETVRNAINNHYRKWLQETRLVVPTNINIEISPLFALDKDELRQKLKGKRVTFENDLYLGEDVMAYKE